MKEIITDVYTDTPEANTTDGHVRAARREDGTLVLDTNAGDIEITDAYDVTGEHPLTGASLEAVKALAEALEEEGDEESLSAADWLRENIIPQEV